MLSSQMFWIELFMDVAHHSEVHKLSDSECHGNILLAVPPGLRFKYCRS
jgi:hypothetical protein